MDNIETFQKRAAEYLELLFEFLHEHNLIEKVFVDHIGYDSGSNQEYENLRKILEEHSEYLYQANISERRISVFKLNQKISCHQKNLETQYIELADQKPDGSQSEGFDHIEIHPQNISFEELIEICESKNLGFKKKERPHHVTFDLKLSNDLGVKLTNTKLFEKIKNEM